MAIIQEQQLLGTVEYNQYWRENVIIVFLALDLFELSLGSAFLKYAE